MKAKTRGRLSIQPALFIFKGVKDLPLNMAYLKSEKTAAGDEVYTPFYAVDPLLEFIPKDKKIWCPFDESWSAFYQTFAEKGYQVTKSAINDGQDFFEYLPPDGFDIIISNPPFSKKDKVLERLYALEKPFAMLLPVSTIQARGRFRLFRKGLELLIFDGRVDYHTRQNFTEFTKGVHFGSAYFCRNFLPEKLVFRKLQKYQRPLKREGVVTKCLG